jgi:hypothetical protein
LGEIKRTHAGYRKSPKDNKSLSLRADKMPIQWGQLKYDKTVAHTRFLRPREEERDDGTGTKLSRAGRALLLRLRKSYTIFGKFRHVVNI